MLGHARRSPFAGDAYRPAVVTARCPVDNAYYYPSFGGATLSLNAVRDVVYTNPDEQTGAHNRARHIHISSSVDLAPQVSIIPGPNPPLTWHTKDDLRFSWCR